MEFYRQNIFFLLLMIKIGKARLLPLGKKLLVFPNAETNHVRHVRPVLKPTQ